MPAYMTRSETLLRLEAYDLDAEAMDVVTEFDILAASDELDDMAPFKGTKPADQDRQFPRVEDGVTVPEPVLNWIALRAYQLGANVAPPVRSTSAGRTAVTYDRPKPSQVERRMEYLLSPYLEMYGSRGYGTKSYPTRLTWRERTSV